MKLSVKNLGPIKQKSTIDLDQRFYTFVGYNGSGKTYMANLLAMLKDSDFFDENDIHIFDIPKETTQFEITREAIFEINLYVQKQILNNIHNRFNISKDHFILRDLILDIDEIYQKIYEVEIEYIFIYEWGDNITKGEKPISVFKITKDSKSDTVYIINEAFESVEKINELWNSYLFKRDNQNSSIWNHATRTYSEKKSALYSFLEKAFNQKIFFDVFQRNWLFFLPSHRSFFPSYWKYIFSVEKENNEKIAELARNGICEFGDLIKTPYTDYTNKLIKAIDRIDKGFYQEKDTYKDLLEELEALMQGKLITRNGKEGISRREFKLELEEGRELDMHMASSSSNQLTLLYLYFKYWVQAHNNFLIIDEPEENLHPKNQVLLVDILMKFAARNNNRVLVTTHSSLMTEAINNHIRRSYLREQEEKKDNKELKPSDFGVYFFNGKGFKEYKVDKYGAFFKDFAKVEDEIREEAYRLKDQIFKMNDK